MFFCQWWGSGSGRIRWLSACRILIRDFFSSDPDPTCNNGCVKLFSSWTKYILIRFFSLSWAGSENVASPSRYMLYTPLWSGGRTGITVPDPARADCRSGQWGHATNLRGMRSWSPLNAASPTSRFRGRQMFSIVGSTGCLLCPILEWTHLEAQYNGIPRILNQINNSMPKWDKIA